MTRPTWHEYFLSIAHTASTRTTCLATPVGAVIVRDKQILATGYNSPPSGSYHCSEQGYCYPGVEICSQSSRPSRAIHAEANAIAQCARHGIPTEGAIIYTTLEPCLNCLKLIIAAGIKEIYFETPFGKKDAVRDAYLTENLIKITQLQP